MKKIKITFEETKKKDKYEKYPQLDMDELAFADNEKAEQMRIDYIKSMKKYVVKRFTVVFVIIAICLFGIATVGGWLFGNFITSSNSSVTNTYILNNNTKVFHRTTCSSIDDIKPTNFKAFHDSKEKMISRGFSPCERCKP